jgi:hypothetical protein
MDPTPTQSWVDKIRKHVDKVLIAASGIAILISGYVTFDYRAYINCQAYHMEAAHNTNSVFAESLRVLLTQPPRPVEERRLAFERLQAALDRQERIQEQLGDCK